MHQQNYSRKINHGHWSSVRSVWQLLTVKRVRLFFSVKVWKQHRLLWNKTGHNKLYDNDISKWVFSIYSTPLVQFDIHLPFCTSISSSSSSLFLIPGAPGTWPVCNIISSLWTSSNDFALAIAACTMKASSRSGKYKEFYNIPEILPRSICQKSL